jgi:hypothetical protein
MAFRHGPYPTGDARSKGVYRGNAALHRVYTGAVPVFKSHLGPGRSFRIDGR